MSRRHIPSEELISAKALKARWPGILDKELANLIEAKEIKAFWLSKNQLAEGNRPTTTCEPGASPQINYGGKTPVYDWENIIFLKEQLDHLEFINPDFLLQIVEDDELKSEKPGLEGEVEELRARLKRVHTILAGVASGEANRERPTVSLARTVAAQLTRFKAENGIFRAEIDRLKASSVGPLPRLEEAKAKNTSARWQAYLAICIPLALRIKDAGRAFTSKEIREELIQLGLPALGEQALDIFRKAMPAECINTGGRPPKGKTSK